MRLRAQEKMNNILRKRLSCPRTARPIRERSSLNDRALVFCYNVISNGVKSTGARVSLSLS
jgi:hypothetical protein